MKIKTCKNCKMMYDGDKCPGCGGQEYSENSKGRVIILDPQNSEIAQNLKVTGKGAYAIRI